MIPSIIPSLKTSPSPVGRWGGHTGVCEGAERLIKPLEKALAHFWEPVSEAYDHRDRDPLSGQGHQLMSRDISRDPLGVDKGGSVPCCLELARTEMVSFYLLLKKEKRMEKVRLESMLY